MNILKLSDLELESQIKLAVTEENKAKTQVLHLLAEIERRRLYSKEHPSLFEYCVKVLKYSSGAAQRRIDTMRAMKLIPEIENKLISGELNLTSVSQAQSFFRQEAKQEKVYSVEDKKKLLEKLENKSTRECVETLVSISPQSVSQDRRRELTPEKIELKLSLDKNLINKLDRLKALMSHKNPHMTDAELIGQLADMALAKLNPEMKAKKMASQAKAAHGDALMSASIGKNPLPATAVRQSDQSPRRVAVRPYISAQTKRQVWLRDRGRCTYKNCNSTHFLEIDHRQPVALDGTNDLSNLRLLCRAHNQRAAIQSFGFKYINRFVN